MTTKKLFDAPVRTSEAIACVLEEAGIDMIFGIVGGDTWMLFDALNEHRDTIRAVTVREESLAGVMAEVYGRLTGRPGVVYGQGAWVISNALLGTIEAHLSSSPMLLLADLTDGQPFAHHAHYQTGAGNYGGFDAHQTLSGVTKRTTVVTTGPQAVQSVQLGIKHATTGERGPVAVLFSSSALKSKVGPDSVPAIYPTARYLQPAVQVAPDAQLRDVIAQIAAARQPVIVAGNGVRVSRGFDQLAAFAERFGLPVATTAGGKGVFAETHELALGVLGSNGRPLANALIAQADLVVVLGSKLAPPDTANEHPDLLNPTRQTFIQVDIEPANLAWTYPADTTVVGDIAATLGRILELTESESAPISDVLANRRSVVAAAREEHGWFDVDASYAEDLPMLPERFVKVLNAALPENAIVSCDAGENRLFMMHLFQTKSANSYLQSAGVGGMGYAIPAALGAKLVFPERPAVAVCGDGGFGMSINGLMTALEERIPIIVVIMNNNVLGWVYNGMGERRVNAELGEYNYAAIAAAMGCGARRVTTAEEFDAAIAAALTHDGPFVIDAVTAIDEKHSYLQATSRLVGGRA